MILNESEEYIHIETNYKTNIIEVTADSVSFIYFDDDDDFQNGEMTIENFKSDFKKNE